MAWPLVEEFFCGFPFCGQQVFFFMCSLRSRGEGGWTLVVQPLNKNIFVVFTFVSGVFPLMKIRLIYPPPLSGFEKTSYFFSFLRNLYIFESNIIWSFNSFISGELWSKTNIVLHGQEQSSPYYLDPALTLRIGEGQQ